MKLFLSSLGVPKQYEKKLLQMIGKTPSDVRIAFITTAANPYPKKMQAFTEKAKKLFDEWQATVTYVSLEDYRGRPEALEKILRQNDLIWLAGGNCYYLRYWMRESGFDQILPKLLADNVVVAGESAAAMVMGSTIKYAHDLQEPENGPEIIQDGLGVVDYNIVPHVDSPKHSKEMRKMADRLKHEGYKTLLLSDEEAIIAS
ncbi:MAG: Type 1 glutamine amidotransferase-like domain-containing protein [bacterium]|nr:Type 1 glutamine amidotransferase-like domain-containing protein [bacterium]